MKSIFRRVLCCLLSIVLVFGSGIAAFAAEESDTDTVVIVNDINYNPIINTDDGSVVFNFKDYQYDLLFTTGFSQNFTELFSKDVMDKITGGEMSTLEIITLLIDYLGFSGDINNIVAKVLEIAMELVGSSDFENFDIQAIIKSIDFKKYAEDIKAKIEDSVTSFGSIKMNADGTPKKANTGAFYYLGNLDDLFSDDYEIADLVSGNIGEAVAEKIGYENTYIFTYDWRLDPKVNAELLKDYIEDVKAETGSDKVSVLSEGYGSTVATTYLSEYADDAAESVKNFVTVSSEFLGTSLVGDYFKGDVVNELTNLTTFTSAYIRYTNDISDNPITAFTTWLLNYIMNNEWELQSFCIHIEQLLTVFNYTFSATGITDIYTSMPGIWALVPVNDFEAAAEKIFGEEPSGELYDMVSEFKNIQMNYEDILNNAKDSGINVSIVASWDLQIVPFGKNSGVQSDGIVDTEYASFGASCVELNEVADAMNTEQYSEDGHDHISSNYDMLTPWYSYGGICHYVDASTCALPENTWFIKNMKHDTFSYDSNSADFLTWLLTADEERTVWQDSAYKQFMSYNRYVNPGILSSDGIVKNPDSDIPGKYLMGDINLDGLVTSIDSRLALRHDSGMEEIEYGSMPFKNGDVYPDNIINTADARKILLMSSGLIDGMRSGVKFDYDTEESNLPASEYSIELRPYYNSITNQLELTLVIPNAKGSYSGNFVVKFDGNMFTYVDSDETILENGYVVAGAPIENTLTCSYSTSTDITSYDCEKNGDLVLTTFYLDVTRKNIKATSVSAGSAYFYENGGRVYVTPVTVDLDEDFFFMFGDADDNGRLTAADARLILRIAARLETVKDNAMFKRCDVDFDGKITAKDARLVLRASAELINSFKDAN